MIHRSPHPDVAIPDRPLTEWLLESAERRPQQPDDEAGEVPKTFVVLKGEATSLSIVEWVAQHVAPHKKVREVEVIDQIPKSASGKILRRVLVERERGRV